MLSTRVANAKEAITFLKEGPFPVDLYALAHTHGVTTIEEAELKTIDAFLMPQGDEYTVVVNRNHLPARKRFSIAHEIGHILIAEQQSEMQYRKPTCGGTARDPVERACNQLAADILMPEEPFKAIAESYAWGIQGAVILSEMFATSLESTLRRCVELASIPLALITWRILPSSKPIHRYTLTTPGSSLRVLGFDRQKYLADVPSLSQSYSAQGTWKGIVPFEVSVRGNSLPITRSFVTESMGTGRGDTRRVFSLVRLSEQLTREEPTR